MRIMILLGLALLACAFAPIPYASAAGGSHAQYVGGTLATVNQDAGGTIQTTDDAVFLFKVKAAGVRIPYERINMLEYGQKVDRRYLAAMLISPMFLLSKKRDHFLTIGYQDDDGRQQAMVLRVEKAKIRSVLVSLEARTGKKIQYQDNEARKAGKG